MKKQNITVRIDPDLKKAAEASAEYLGLTLTAVIHRALHEVIKEASDKLERQSQLHEKLTSFLPHRFYITAAEREIKLLEALGINPATFTNSQFDAVAFKQYRELIKQYWVDEMKTADPSKTA